MENELPHASFENNKTIPWHEDEMISFRGHLLVYTIAGDGTCIVRLPGRTSVELQELVRRHGTAVKPPLEWRKRNAKQERY
jgi:hypothetical protein